MPVAEYKFCVFGSGGVGKSCLTLQFVQGVFVPKYDPTIEDVYKKTVEVDEKQYSLEILDTAGTEEFSAMRDLYVKNGQGFILVYSITSQSTFNDLTEFYERILRVKDSQPPIVLVGNKSDLEDERVVGRELGQELARKWKCTFFEISAKDRGNVNEVFFELVRQTNRITNNAFNSSQVRQSFTDDGRSEKNSTMATSVQGRKVHSHRHFRHIRSEKCHIF